MIRIFLWGVLFAAAAVQAAASDSCIECHSNREMMESLGYPGFTVTAGEVAAQTHMSAGCAQCHLGNPRASDQAEAHRGRVRLLVVSKKGLLPVTSARRFPLEYGTNLANRIYAVTKRSGKKEKDAAVVALSWHDKKRESLTQDFEVMRVTCGSCHSREFAEFSRSTMGTNAKQSQYGGWLNKERGPHNCGPWFEGNFEAIQGATALPMTQEGARVNQRTCNTCHVGCLDCHFHPQAKNPADPSLGPHSFVKTPPSESCYGNGRNSICHSGPEERRRGAGYFGGSFSFPEGGTPDVHLKAKVGCLECHQTTKKNPELGHGMVKRQAQDSCARCHPKVVAGHARSRHRSLSCEACHVQAVAGYQGTYWGPGKVAGIPTPYVKHKAYYGVMPEPILIRDQGGRWIPVKPFPMAVMNQKGSPYQPGLHWRYPRELPALKRTDDAWGYVGLFDGLPENNRALLWIQMDKMSHKLGKSRSCASCHGTPDGSQLQKVAWDYSDPGALPFSGSHEVVANGTGLFIVNQRSEKIEPEKGYVVSSFAPWVYLKDAWKIPGDFALPLLKDPGVIRTYGGNAALAKKAGILH